MIKINDKLVTQARFPDNSLRIETDYKDIDFDLSWMGVPSGNKILTWHYENDA
jgi:hypothetical protein